MGESTDDRKPVGTWFGPNTVAQVRYEVAEAKIRKSIILVIFLLLRSFVN